MARKYWAAIVFGGIGLAAIAGLLWGQLRPEYAEYQIRTVTTMTSATRSPAEGLPTIARVYFARKDGSIGQRTAEVYNHRPCTSTTYWDASLSEEVSSSDCVAMKSTVPFTSFPRSPAIPRPSCYAGREDRFTGDETIQGLRVERMEVDNQDVKAVTFVAPSLGCLTVRGLYYWKGKDGQVANTTFDEPVEIKIGSPDPSLFQTPSHFSEVPPSERKDAQDKYFTGANEGAACLRDGNERDDKRYFAARKERENKSSVLARVNDLRRRIFGTRLQVSPHDARANAQSSAP